MNAVPDEFDSPDETGQPGPWIIAGFHGKCSRGGELIGVGEDVRADGDGGWECKECVDEDGETVPLSYQGWKEGDPELSTAQQMIHNGELRRVYDDGDEPTFGYWEAGDY